ncbi:MAG TPA: hypothetical protein VJA21_32595 [Verrucomicrobiae bacterium]
MQKTHSLLVAVSTVLFFATTGQQARSAAPAFSDANWVSMGARGGVSGPYFWSPIGASAVDAAGNLYIGGSFTNVCGVAASNIARWNGTDWAAVGAGLNGYVGALLVSGTNLYVGGSFTTAGGIAASNVARWDGTAWSALGSGMDGSVRDMALSGSDLYVIGSFSTAGGIAATNLAKWDGNTWSAPVSLLTDVGGADALAVSGSEIYVGGSFSVINDVSANHIAKWTPGTGWTALGSGMEAGFPGGGNVFALLFSGGFLYAGGDFWTAGGIDVNCVARWNGSAWSALGSGLQGAGFNYPGVSRLAMSGTTLYAVGSFAKPGGTVADGIARWNGSSWSSLGSGIATIPGQDPWAMAIAASGNNVYVLGAFSIAGGVPADGLAGWNGSAWSALVPAGAPSPTSVSGAVTTMAVSGTNLYVGGEFGTAGTEIARCLAWWNGTTWSPLGSGANAPWGLTLATSGTNLYAGMRFTPSGGVEGSYVARWNGSSWTALGEAFDADISTLAFSGNDIYAGGGFYLIPGGIPAQGVAKWDGSGWSPLGAGLNGSALALAVSGTNLYVGGSFTSAGGVPMANIARWDGTAWSPLGSGLDGGSVLALAVWNSDLYAGGSFNTAGGSPANWIARWNGTSWSALGSGLGNTRPWSPNVAALLPSGTNLYVGGSFTTAGGVSAPSIARWNGGAWSPLGSGVNDTVNSLAIVGSDLYAGGNFLFAGGKDSPWIARAYLVAPPGGVVDSVAASPGTATVHCYGNPGHQFDVQRAASLAPPIAWTTVNPNPLSPAADGVFNFTDTTATNGAGFYRSRER